MPKVKLFAAIPRKPGVTPQEFHDHWRHPHGTLARGISTIRKYVQSHHIDCPLLDARQTRFEGIAEVWMDNLDDALALPEEPIYVRDAVPDEPLFIDLPQLRFFITEERVIVSGPDLREKVATGDACWRDDDRAINIKVIQLVETAGWEATGSTREAELGRAIGAIKHVYCHPATAAYRASMPPFLGVRELWWPTVSAFNAGVSGTSATKAWAELLGEPSAGTTLLAQSERFR